MILTTEVGSVTTHFKVTQDPPEVFGIFPESAAPGEQVVAMELMAKEVKEDTQNEAPTGGNGTS